MEEKPRKTGIDVIDTVSWGTHFCLLYETKQDLVEILVPYFKAGLENNEFCAWLTSKPVSKEEAEEAMRNAVPDFAHYLERGQMEIVPHTEWYLKERVFNLQRVLDACVDKLNQALDKGYEGMRVTGNAAWRGEKEWRNLTDYEEEVNSVIGKYRTLAICTYPLGECGASEIINVVHNHQLALIRHAGEWVLTKSSLDERVEETLQESEQKYRSLFEQMLEGFAYCQIVVDENNQPIDFVYLEVNDAFERLTGLRREDVIGKKVTEAIPGTKESHPELFSIYGKVALTGEETQFDLYFKPLAIWLTISVYSPKKGYFIAVFENITERKLAEESQEMTSDATSVRRVTPPQERFIRAGFTGFKDQEVIELLLSLVLSPRKCKWLARECIEQFKSLREFLAASIEELEHLGVPRRCMFFIRLLHELPVEILKQKIIEQPVQSSSKEIFDYLYYSMRDLKKEVFKVIYLNNRNQIIDTADLFEGTLDSISIRPREIIESVTKYGATTLIFAHNHPSGDPTPSKTDKQLTRDMVFVGMILQIKVLDHIIIGENRYFSFADEGLIQQYEDDFLNIKIRRMADTGHHLKKSRSLAPLC